VLLVVAAVVAGLLSRSPGGTGGSGSRPAAAADPAPTPLDRVDVSALPVARGLSCGDLDSADVQEAMGARVASTAHYAVGDRAVLVPGVRDRSHEDDCTFRSAAGAQARTWVFAEPVTARVARALAGEARAARGCTTVDVGPRFGRPTVTTRCSARTYPGGAPARSVTLQGLFGDAWLSCQLTLPTTEADTIGRAQQWCVRVATSASRR
jgi:hypothetical protein